MLILLILTGGGVIVEKPIKAGRVHIGRHELPQLDVKHVRTIINVQGKLVFKGEAIIGAGSKIVVDSNARLTLGEHFIVTGNTTILCHHSITFGKRCLLSWENLIMDTDCHKIYDKQTNRIINPPAPIYIGNNVWMGCRNTILKGCRIPDNVVIASNSLISQKLDVPNCIYGNHGKIIKENIYWRG